jgi:GT2 family glycosyltransferase
MNTDNSFSNIQKDLALCICTYKRPHPITLLLRDILEQTIQPGFIVIVDGDPTSGRVLEELQKINFHCDVSVRYVPSNHPNLPYQRYIGWLAVKRVDCGKILFLDDDLHIEQLDALQKVIQPFGDDHAVIGVTARMTDQPSDSQLLNRQNSQHPNWELPQVIAQIIQKWGSANRIRPGQLTPSGHRSPIEFRGRPYELVDWLYGRVMAYRMDALTQDIFSDDLFAMYHLRCGKAEDTFLSHRISKNGKMLKAFNATFSHSCDILANAYPIDPYRLAYATAYSRRLLNDDYRPGQAPTLLDRQALIKSYAGNILLNWWGALINFRKDRFVYAWGYLLGALRGLFQKPTAKRLTPHINWWTDAEEPLSKLEILQ